MNCLDESLGHRKIPFFDKLGYGIGNFSTGVAIQVVGAYLVFYCTAILDIPGSLVGIAVSLGIIWDAITDPLMGYFSDITKSKTFGRRHLYLLIGGIGIAITNFFLWNIDRSLSTSIKFTIILTDLLLVKTFMTIYITPYTALGAELSNDYNERTSIQGVKTIFFLIGLAFVSVLGMYMFFQPSPKFPIGQLNPFAYRNMGIFTSVIIAVFSVVCFGATKKYIPILNKTLPSEDGGIVNLARSFKGVFLNRTFRYVAFAYMFTNIASALLSNIGLHVFTYTFSLSSQQIALIIGVQFTVSILSQPVWAYTARKIDKKPSMILGILICILSSIIFIGMVFMKDIIGGNPMWFIPFTILAGFGTGGLFTLPLSMIADIIDVEDLNTGKRSEGTYYGCLTLFYKLSQSVTLFIIGIMLDLVKFDSDLPVQAESTVIILGLMLGVGTIISFIMAFLSLKGYGLNRIKLEDVQRKIGERNRNPKLSV